MKYYADKKEKKDSYKPPAGVQAEARRALEWIKNGDAGSGFTDVGRKRASDLASGRSVSLKTIKRMKSYLARHGVDKQGEGWSKGSKGYPSPGRVAWAAWGGDAAKSWVNGILGESDSKESKKKNTDYDHMIKHRKGDPADKELYSRVKSEAKEKFDVYPSAVANAWVVKEYKKRGGTYGKETKKESSKVVWYKEGASEHDHKLRSDQCPLCRPELSEDIDAILKMQPVEASDNKSNSYGKGHVKIIGPVEHIYDWAKEPQHNVPKQDEQTEVDNQGNKDWYNED